jgi:hypothetical protein
MTPFLIKLTPFSTTDHVVIRSPPIHPRPLRRLHPLRLPLHLHLPLPLRLSLVKTSIESLTIKERSVLS